VLIGAGLDAAALQAELDAALGVAAVA